MTCLLHCPPRGWGLFVGSLVFGGCAAYGGAPALGTMPPQGNRSGAVDSPAETTGRGTGEDGGRTATPVLSPVPVVAAPDASEAARARATIMRLMAEARKPHGAPPLTALALLDEIATYRSRDMADRGYFGHVDPDGVTPFEVMRRMGATFRTASEIIAWNTAGPDRGPELAVQGWLDSPGHREAMRDPRHLKAGVGIARNENRRYYTVLFTD
ncbi:MAG: CAP domain-containing protein [Candidatus Sericytochromatia bacterium]|nr:CAP domain-containing protein [Candidatus Sericytochromatia bacterium]